MNWGAFDLNLLIVFDAVMQERNVTRAGGKIGLSQPASMRSRASLTVLGTGPGAPYTITAKRPHLPADLIRHIQGR
jgi:hypothetical protein